MTPLFSPATLAGLELPAVLALLSELAATDVGHTAALALAPAASEEELAARRRRYEEAVLLLIEGRLVPSFEEPLLPVFERLATTQLDPTAADLLLLADLLSASRDVAARILAGAASFPELGTAGRALPEVEPLRRRIAAVFDRRGRVKDDASPALAKLRARVRGVREGLHRDLQGTLSRYQEHLAEETIPLHEGRLVLLVKTGARGQLRGLVHGRSGSGKSVYFEPLELVEGNNRLSEAIAEEEEERSRIVAELLAAARAALPALAAHREFVAGLDLLQAAARFAELARGRLAEVAESGELRLVAARHPLLEAGLAALRERALGTSGHSGAVVPLDLELDGERRVLVVTGPNAGGKTVALKTVGLLALMTQCGLPVPAAAGTRLPFVAAAVAALGDEQDLLADRSTFSARLLRLGEAWEAAGPGALVLLDELGSGTDPEEGAALAVALLERLLAGGCLAVLTTHLTRLAAAALEAAGAACAAMEFDGATGAPTYRLLPGAPGASEALALARRLGLDPGWIARAESLLEPKHRGLQTLLQEVEKTRLELAERVNEVERLRGEQLIQVREMERERSELVSERREVAGRLRRELEAFRSEVAGRLREEEGRLREAFAEGRRKGIAAQATDRLFANVPAALVELDSSLQSSEVAVGERVRHRRLGWEGKVEKLFANGSTAEVAVAGKRVRCPVAELSPVAGEVQPARRALGWRSEAAPAPELVAELHLIGERVEPALERLDAYLDTALLAGRGEVRVVHGHGTGRLKQAVRAHLRGHPAVAAFRAGAANEGGDGATVVTLRGE